MNAILHTVPGTTPLVAMALIDIAVSNVCVERMIYNNLACLIPNFFSSIYIDKVQLFELRQKLERLLRINSIKEKLSTA